MMVGISSFDLGVPLWAAECYDPMVVCGDVVYFAVGRIPRQVTRSVSSVFHGVSHLGRPTNSQLRGIAQWVMGGPKILGRGLSRIQGVMFVGSRTEWSVMFMRRTPPHRGQYRTA